MTVPHTTQPAEPGPQSYLHNRLKHHQSGGLITIHTSFSRTQVRLQAGEKWLAAGLMMDLRLELGHTDSSAGHGLSDNPIALCGCSYWRCICLNTLRLNQANWRERVTLCSNQQHKSQLDPVRRWRRQLQAVMTLQYPGLSPDASGWEKAFDQQPCGIDLNQGWKVAESCCCFPTYHLLAPSTKFSAHF